MASAAPFVTVAFVVFVFARWYQWLKHNSIKHIRGPAVKSKLIGKSNRMSVGLEVLIRRFEGNTRDIGHQQSVGDLDFKWIREYGPTWRLHGPLGVRQFFSADVLVCLSNPLRRPKSL